mgnify:CR=1 FL=1
MRWIRIGLDRLRGLFGRDRVTGDIHDELRHHVDMAAAEHERRGLSPDAARAAALRQVGNLPLLQDRAYDVRGGGIMEEIVRDSRFAVRVLVRQPGFSLVALLTIALGIGATSTIFAVANGVLLRPLPYPDAGQLAMVWMDNTRIPLQEDWHSLPNIEDYRAGNSSFDAIAVFNTRSYNLTGASNAERLSGAAASANLFRVLGVAPQLGRVFTDEEDQPEQDGVVVLSHRLWMRAFAGDRQILGRRIELSGRSREVIGVMPETFGFPESTTEFWVPVAPPERLRTSRGSLWLQAVGRLKPEVTIAQAQSDLNVINADLIARFPDQVGYGVYAVGYFDQLVGRTRPAILALLGAVGFLLLLACVNVANLLLARASVREREIALRAAIGAGRIRLMRQLLTESAVLAVVGGVLGVGVAWVGLKVLVAAAPTDLPRLAEIALDLRVVGFSFATAMVTGLAIGVVPAVQISQTRLGLALKEGGRSASSSVGRAVRQTLVVVQVALALVLLTGAGLMVQSFLKMQRVDLGFDVSQLLTMRVTLAGDAYQAPEAAVDFFSRTLNGVRSTPGVSDASLITSVFLSATPNSTTFNIEGRPTFTAANSVEVPIDSAAPGYFATMAVPVVRGRDFSDSDTADAPRVVVINETMARRFWPDEDPVGRRMTYGEPGPDASWFTIVGVVGDTRRVGYDAPVRPETYLAMAQNPSRSMVLVARSSLESAALADTLRGVVRGIDPSQPVYAVASGDELVRTLTAERRLNTLLFGVFAFVAALLAAAGVYGVVAYSVEQRTRELGVRLALGARPIEVFRLVLREGLTLALVGVTAGVLVAVAVTSTMRNLLYDTAATDVVTYATMALVALAVATLACLVPAIRATRVDPLTALCAE